MLINLMKYLRGYLRVVITGHSPERFLNLCSNKKLLLWNLVSTKDGYEFNISKQAFYELKPLLKKTKTNVKIIDKVGLPFFLYRYRKRKLFAIGILISMCLIYSMTLFVWDIKVVGAYSYTKEDIIRYVEENYVSLGSMKNQVDCPKLEEALREKYENIAWISCELKGTQLTVHFKETIKQNEIVTSDQPYDLVALKDGVIESIITREGTPVVKKKDIVKKGDILISGAIHILDDSNEVIESSYICAQGDIKARTVYEYEDSFSMSYYEKNYTGNDKTYFTFYGFGYEFTPLTPKISYESYDLVEEQKQIKIGHTYYFPFSYKAVKIKESKPVRKTYTQEEAAKKAKEQLNKFNEVLLEKGVEIVGNNVKISISDDTCTAKGQIQVVEPIGKLRAISPQEQTEIKQDGGTTE